MKFGFEVRLRNKEATPYTESFTFPKLNLSTLSPLAPDVKYYDNHYTNGPGINEDALLAEIKNGTIVSQGLQVDNTGYFNADENVYAGYAMYTGEYGPWGVLAGVRIEDTAAKYGFYDFDGDGNPILDGSGNPVFERVAHQYTNVFPTLQLRYEFSSDLIARATYSTGIGRPGFTQLAQPTTIDVSTGHDHNRKSNIEAHDGQQFRPGRGILSQRRRHRPIRRFRQGIRGLYLFAQCRSIQRPASARCKPCASGHLWQYSDGLCTGCRSELSAEIYVPAEAVRRIGPRRKRHLCDEQRRVRPGENEALPGTSRVTYNVGSFYEAYGLSVRLAAQYVAHSLYQVGGSRSTDVFEDSRLTLDFTSSYDFDDDWSVYFNVKNLTNAPLRIYMGTPNWVIQREFYRADL